MHIINITVRGKVAVNPAQDRYVCGNSDFVVRFDFDAEWDAFDTKTARFIKEDGTPYDVVFSGNECPVPVIADTYKMHVGVYAGDLSTTTAAYVPCKKSILCGGGVPAAPAEDVYNQIMAALNENTEAAKGTAETLQKTFGDGGLYLIRQYGTDRFDRTYDEIDAAVKAGKTCILTDSIGRVHLFSNYSASGKLIFRAVEHGTPIGGGSYTTLTEREVHIDKDGKTNNIAISPIKTPTPNKLTIEQNGETVVFDGRENVNIKIEGVPDPGKAHQQLVSDADGKAVWQEQIAYKYVKSGVVDILKEETLISLGDDDGNGKDDMFASSTPLAAMPEGGKQYEVTINSTKYTTTAVSIEEDGKQVIVLLGNAHSYNPDEYADTGEPFALMLLEPEVQALSGGFTLMLLHEADAVTLSIKGDGVVTTIKKIDPDLLPDTHKTIVMMIDADGNVTCDTPFTDVIKLTNGELQSALKVVQTGNWAGMDATKEGNVQVRRQVLNSPNGEVTVLQIAFSQFADHGDAPYSKEMQKFILWMQDGVPQLQPWTSYSLPVMDGGWTPPDTVYYLRYEGGYWKPTTIADLKKDLGLT